MMREYILRHIDPSVTKLARPVMAEIMPETYGIMVLSGRCDQSCSLLRRTKQVKQIVLRRA
jgi:hypothetical protein